MISNTKINFSSSIRHHNLFKLLEEKFRFDSIQLETISMSPFIIDEFDFSDAYLRDHFEYYNSGFVAIGNVAFNTDLASDIKIIELDSEDGSKFSGSIIYNDNTEEKVYVY